MSTCSVGSARTLRGIASPGSLRSRPACVVSSFSNCAANVWALAKSPLSSALSNALRTAPRSASAGVSLSNCLSVLLRRSSAGTIFSSCLDSEIMRSNPAGVFCSFSNCADSASALAKSPLARALSNALCMSCLALTSCSCFCKSGITRLACSKSVVTRSRSVDCKVSNGWFFISSSV